MAPKDKQAKKRVITHKPKLAHKLAKYVRAYPVHLTPHPQLPSLSHLAHGGPSRPKVTNRSNTWYPSDDQPTPYKRPSNRPKAQPAASSLTPGKVLILLSGKYRGKRVVLLKRLPSGLLLVAGPHKLNGVPLRRVNQAYVVATAVNVALDGVNVAEINDEYFRRVVPKGKRAEGAFKAGKRDFTEDQKKQQAARYEKGKATQRVVDTALVANIKKVPFLRRYISSRFTLYNNTRPHELVF